MEKRLVDLTKTDVLEDGDYLFVNHGDNPVQVSFPFIKEQIAPNDTTLSESGKFADAKVVGDKLNEHSQSIETINTEIEAIKDDYATKEETETKSHAEETFATKISLSSLQEDLNGVKKDYLTKQEDQENRDTEFYEGRKYNGMSYAGKTSDKGVQLHSVKGKTVQQTTNGYQLFDASKLATKSQSGATITNNGDGSFTISGSGNLTDSISLFMVEVTSEILPLLKKGTIFVKFDETTYPYCVFKIMDSSNGLLLGFNNYEQVNLSKEITEDILNNAAKVYLQFYGASGHAIKTGTIKPMLYQDGDGTWEPYTGGIPAPNPDYPMEIENVEISNIFSTNDYNTDDNVELIGAYLNNKGEELYDTIAWSISKYITIPSGFDKLISKGMSGRVPSICFYDKSKKFISGEAYNNRLNFDISIPENAKFFRFSSLISNRKNEHLFVSSYNYNTIETSLTLAEGDTYENGQVTRVRKQITFDGSSDESWGMILNTSENQIIVFICNNPRIEIENYSTDYFCNRSEPNSTNAAGVAEGTYVFDNTLRIALDREKASSVEELRTWLSTHPLTIEYELATPTTEQLKIPTAPSYFPYTEVSTDNELETDITWKVLADCDNSLAQEELEQRILALETKAIE